MKTQKEKLSAEQIINFFEQKPTFDRSNTDSNLDGWPTTKGGLYMISDITNFFEKKGISKKSVEEALYNFFQKQDVFIFSKMEKMEKGKTHNINICRVFNHNPKYNQHKQGFIYYFYDISMEQALKLKAEYEAESLKAMLPLIEKRNSFKKNVSVTKKVKEEVKIKRNTKKKALIEV